MGSIEKGCSTLSTKKLLASVKVLRDEGEILQEQIVSLKLELAATKQENGLLFEEIQACNRELSILSQDNRKCYEQLMAEREAKQSLEQRLAESELAERKLLEVSLTIAELISMRTQALEKQRKAVYARIEAFKLMQQRRQQERSKLGASIEVRKPCS